MRITVLITFTVILFFLVCGSNTYADLVSEGRALLFNQGNPTYSGLISANQKFKAALSNNPNNPEANLFYAATRIGAFALEKGSGRGFETMRDVFESLGMTRNSNVFLDDGSPYNTPSELPGNSPNGEAIRQFLAGPYLILLDGALANLAKIGNLFQTTLTAAETGDEAVEVDYGDVLMYQAMLNANKCLVLIISSYNLGVDLAEMSKINSDRFDINTDLLNAYPDFLKLINGGEATLQSAEEALLDAIKSYLDASAFIRTETDNQLDDLITLDSDDVADEALLRQNLIELRDSLNQNRTADLTDNEEQVSLNPNPFFGYASGPYNLRDFLPRFNRCNDPIPGTMGHGLGDDPTLGGILADFSQAAWDIEIEPCSMAMPWLPLLLLN